MERGQYIEQLFKANYTRLCYYASRLLEDPEAAEDLVQDTFLRLWNSETELTAGLETKSYLYTSVRNACLNRLRHEKVQQKYVAAVAHAGAVEEEKGLDHLIRAEVLGEIHRAIELLPAGCREVLRLAYFELLRNEEIAARLGVSINTVKTQKARGLQLLRLRLGPASWFLLICLMRS